MKVGLILAGGMAKGAYELGALRAIREVFLPEEITHISAASVGAINAVAFSADELSLAQEMWESINLTSEKVFLSTLFKSDLFASAVEKAAALAPRCSKLYVPVLDLFRRELLYPDLLRKDEKDRVLYLKAAMAFPPFCRSVDIGGRHFVDGALADNLPYRPLIKCHIDFAICIYFDNCDYVFSSEYFTDRIIKISFPEENGFLRDSLWFTKDRIAEMTRIGYEKTAAILSCILRDDARDTEAILARIREFSSFGGKKKQLCLTGDMIINNVNRVAAHFAKRKMTD